MFGGKFKRFTPNQLYKRANKGELGKNLFGKSLAGASSAAKKISKADATKAVVELLQKCCDEAVRHAGAPGGFQNNTDVKIPWPRKMKSVYNGCKKIGLRKQCDKLVKRMNKAAENAASEALDIFLDVIKSMNITELQKVLKQVLTKGNSGAITALFKKKSLAALARLFDKIIKKALKKSDVVDLWQKTVKTYNKVPFVTKVRFDIVEYCRELALEGLFFYIALMEVELRGNVKKLMGKSKEVFSAIADGTAKFGF